MTQQRKHLQLENELHFAIKASEFVLHYQPIVSVTTRKVVGAEALIRWEHPSGRRQPDSFIPNIEESELIVDVGDWVIEEACRQANAWNIADSFRMSINVAYRQFINSHFHDHLQSTLERNGMTGSHVELELTERTVGTDETVLRAAINRARNMGAAIALDDFGTGENSLERLRTIVIDTLKIDRSFIIGMTGNQRDFVLVSAIASAAEALGIRVVAEGVETEGHYTLLQQTNCHEAQGYWFSRALPAADFADNFKDQS